MASSSDISVVRVNTGQSANEAPFTDAVLNAFVDARGVTGATVTVWEQLVASYAGLVDVSEAGASHKAGDLFTHAKAMLSYWKGKLDEEVAVESGLGRVRVKQIVRL